MPHWTTTTTGVDNVRCTECERRVLLKPVADYPPYMVGTCAYCRIEYLAKPIAWKIHYPLKQIDLDRVFLRWKKADNAPD